MKNAETQTQNDRLLAYLKGGGTIQPFAALSLLGIYRLGARVFDLRADGHPIERELVEVSNARGGTSRVAAYRMAKKP